MDILIVFGLFGLLGLVMLFMNKLLGPRSTNPTKEQPFECGSPALEAELKPYSIKFYLVAFLFLLFDVEVVFFFPWALVFKRLGWFGFWEMIVFIVILVVGLIYAWSKRVLRWV